MGLRQVGAAVMGPVRKGFGAIQRVGYSGWEKARSAGGAVGAHVSKHRGKYMTGGIGGVSGGAGFAAGRRSRKRKRRK